MRFSGFLGGCVALASFGLVASACGDEANVSIGADPVDRLRDATVDCEAGVRIESSSFGTVTETTESNGTVTRTRLDGEARTEAEERSRRLIAESEGFEADEELSALTFRSTDSVVADGKAYFDDLDDQDGWVTIAISDLDGGADEGLGTINLRRICEADSWFGTFGNAVDSNVAYNDPDDLDVVIIDVQATMERTLPSPGTSMSTLTTIGSSSDSPEPTTTTTVERSPATVPPPADEVRALRDSDFRTLVRFDGQRLASVEARVSNNGGPLVGDTLVTFTYEPVSVEVPTDARTVTRDEWVELAMRSLRVG